MISSTRCVPKRSSNDRHPAGLQCLAIAALAMSIGCGLKTTAVMAAIAAADEARIAAAAAGDEAKAVQYMAPEFIFIHSTGQVDNLEQFRAFSRRAPAPAPAARSILEPPRFIIGTDVVVRTRLTASKPRAGLPDATFRTIDVFTRRSGTWLWLAHQSSIVRPPWNSVSLPEGLVSEFAGTYGTPGAQTRIYAVRAGELFESVLPDGPSDRLLKPISENTFAASTGSATVTFLRDRTGAVTRAQVAGILGLTVLERRR